jgi:6-phosphogluconate dehydrogenase (decarboxylating)
VQLLAGATAELISGGGVCGAEGSYWLAISGTKEQEEAAEKLLTSVASEPSFKL